jgi:hypothetical protein
MDTAKKPPSKKVIWFVTYNGPSITADVLHTKTKLAVDECYTSHGTNMHTLIHLSKRVYKTTVLRVLDAIDVVVIKVSGMDELGKNLRENPHLHRLYKDFDDHTPTFESWIAPTRETKALIRDKDDARVRTLTANSRKRLAKSLVAEGGKVEALQRTVDELSAKLADAQRVIDALNEELVIARTGV